jgi:hypothetical protein
MSPARRSLHTYSTTASIPTTTTAAGGRSARPFCMLLMHAILHIPVQRVCLVPPPMMNAQKKRRRSRCGCGGFSLPHDINVRYPFPVTIPRMTGQICQFVIIGCSGLPPWTMIVQPRPPSPARPPVRRAKDSPLPCRTCSAKMMPRRPPGRIYCFLNILSTDIMSLCLCTNDGAPP